MKRGEFFKEMGTSLFQTVQAVYEPFFKEDIDRLGDAADRALGVSWTPLTKVTDFSTDLEMKFIGGKPIIVMRNGSNMQAFNAVCPVCSNIITLTSLYSTGKCLNCQKEFNFKTQSGDLELLSLPLKFKEDMYFIGIRKLKK